MASIKLYQILQDYIQEGGILALEQLLWQQVQHPVDHLWWGEDLVVGEVGQAVEDVRIIDVLKKRQDCTPPSN